MGIDRKKFKAGKLSSIKKKQEDAKKNNKYFGESNGNRVKFFSLKEEGRYKFRILPPHDENSSPYEVKRTTMLECEIDVYEDGEKTGDTEIKKKSIFIGTQHSKSLKKDPIEVYIDKVYKQAAEIEDKKDKENFLKPIKGCFVSKPMVFGIQPQTKYVCYALNEDGEIGRLELNPAWMKKMETISINEADDDDVLELDIFSDPDEGYPLIITKQKNDKKKVEYIIDADRPKKRESFDDFCERVKVTDAQLEELDSQTPLKELFVDSYTTRDFDLALDGLARFDEENGYDIFEDEDFVSEIEAIKSLVPEFVPKIKEVDSEKEAKEADEEEEKEDKPTKSDSKKPSKIKMRKALKAYIDENYSDEFEGDVKDLDDDTLQEWYLLAESEEELPIEDYNSEDGEEQSDEDEDMSPLEKLRAKTRAKK